jgi:hypothetical protein
MAAVLVVAGGLPSAKKTTISNCLKGHAMKSGLRGVQVLGVLACLLAMAGCGNGNSSSTSSGTSAAPPSSGGGSNGGSGGLTDQQRMQAAESTASKDALCTTLTPFYWEIGDKDGALDSGSGGDGSSSPPNSETPMAIASASKWVFAAYALERLDVSSSNPLSSSQIQQLNFTSGYDNMDDTACFSTTTVAACFNAANPGGGLNSDQHAVDIGHFYYNGAHMQALAVNQLGLGPDFVNFVAGSPKLAAAIQSYVGQDLTIDYSNPSLAGGADTTAATYGSFLRKILNGDLRMRSYLSADKVCAHANSTDCPTAIYSPINQSEPGTPNDVSDEAWHYSLGHWIEDDPTVGDGAFSSAGADGFYPWIDSSKTYYGILARFATPAQVAAAPANDKPGVASVYCGRAIRKAWLTGKAQQ